LFGAPTGLGTSAARIASLLSGRRPAFEISEKDRGFLPTGKR
jgi:hypothetical protein